MIRTIRTIVRKELIRPHEAIEDTFRFRHMLIRDAAYERDVLVRPIRGVALQVSPPFVITEEEIATTARVFGGSLMYRSTRLRNASRYRNESASSVTTRS